MEARVQWRGLLMEIKIVRAAMMKHTHRSSVESSMNEMIQFFFIHKIVRTQSLHTVQQHSPPPQLRTVTLKSTCDALPSGEFPS